MKTFFKALFVICILGITGLVANLYITQETRIFGFKTIPQEYQFEWTTPHRELMFDTPNQGKINALLFETTKLQPKGVIFYCHGKASNLSFKKWGPLIERYTNLGFDFMMLDYRGAGKSSGKMAEQDMLNDCDVVYKYLLDYYPEGSITVYGKSLGTAFATYVASKNNPRALILEAPFFNLFDIGCKTLPNVPPAIIRLVMKYPFETNQYLTNVDCPVYILHGTSDEIIPHDASLELKKIVDNTTNLGSLTIIEGGDHDHLYKHDIFNQKMEEALGVETTLASSQ